MIRGDEPWAWTKRPVPVADSGGGRGRRPGTLSSSDGQRFPVKGKSITARHLSRYFARGQGISTYSHVSDQHSTFDTKVIVATAPESHYVLDGVLGNDTDLPIVEHATDTHGATLGELRAVRFGRQTALPLDPRPRQDHPLPHRARPTVHRSPPARRAAADQAPEHRADHRALGRPAARRRVGAWRARHRRASGRQTVFVETPAEHAHRRDQGIRGASPNRLRPLSRRRDLSAAYRPPVEQG